MHPINSLWRYLYSGLLIGLIPFILLRLYWRACKAPDYQKRMAERFGHYPHPFAKQGIVLHAVSVGEVMAARPLIMRIQKEFPHLPLTVTTMTPTGSRQVEKNFPDVQHVYLPYDYPFAVQRFIKAFDPQLVIIMETEIWPNLIHGLRQAQIPLMIVNARLAEKSFRVYKKFKFFFAPLLRSLSLIAAQASMDADHFIQLGAHPQQVFIMGNIKYDVTLPSGMIERAHGLRQGWSRPVWIASSTHPVEEDLIIATAMQIKKQYPDVLCIIAPRHPERFNDVAEKCQKQGLKIARYSQNEAVNQDTDILLADTLGELYFFYALSDVAVVCGSFAPIGGHNILEPALLGLPIIVGPHMFHFKTILADFLAKDALCQVDEEALLPASLDRLAHKARAAEQGARAHALVLANQGALDKLWMEITKRVALLKGD